MKNLLQNCKIASCNFCKKILSYKATTTNLKTHLKLKHISAYNEITASSSSVSQNQKSVAVRDIGNECDCGVGSIGDGLGSTSNVVRANNDWRRFAESSTSTSSSMANNQTEPPRKRQVTVSSYLPKRIRPGDKQYIDKCLVKLIAYDFQPFSLVQDKGFKEYTHALNPNYELPDRKTISNVLMPMIYEERTQFFNDFVKNNAIMVFLYINGCQCLFNRRHLVFKSDGSLYGYYGSFL